MNIAIIGNSGSGKTWLASKLSEYLSTTVIALDDVFWEPGGFNKKRAEDHIMSRIANSKEQEPRIVEGVFGELVEHFLDDTDLLIWLDTDWLTCERRLKARGSENSKFLGRQQSKEQLDRLIEWAAAYHDRKDPRSYSGHQSIVAEFNGTTITLSSEEDVELFLTQQVSQKG